MSIKDIKSIDVHCHSGQYKNSEFAIKNRFSSAEIEEVLEYQEAANAAYTIISPFDAFVPKEKRNIVKSNDMASEIADKFENVFQWIVVHPDIKETYEQAKERLYMSKCVGIKIHPECHKYYIADRGEELFRFAAEHKAIILSHSGEKYTMPEEFVQFSDRYPEVTLILAHLGCNIDGDYLHQVYAVQQGRGDNIYVDTSSSNNIMCRLIETAVDMIGSKKLIFGSDNPCYFSPMQRARIDSAFISDEDKKNILFKNAVKIFKKIPYEKIYGNNL